MVMRRGWSPSRERKIGNGSWGGFLAALEMTHQKGMWHREIKFIELPTRSQFRTNASSQDGMTKCVISNPPKGGEKSPDRFKQKDPGQGDEVVLLPGNVAPSPQPLSLIRERGIDLRNYSLSRLARPSQKCWPEGRSLEHMP